MPKRSGGRKNGGNKPRLLLPQKPRLVRNRRQMKVPLLVKNDERITSANPGQDEIRYAYARWRAGMAPNPSRPKRSRIAR